MLFSQLLLYFGYVLNVVPGIETTIGTETGGETVAEAGIGLIMTGLEQGIGIATAAEVAAGVLIIAGNVGGPDMMMMRRLEAGLLSGK